MNLNFKTTFLAIAMSCCALAGYSAETKIFNIVDYGAVECKNGSVLSTEAIQSAIDDCSEAGGGTVIIPTGFFSTGTLVLKSNVHIHLEKAAKLLGAPTIESFKELGSATEEPRFQRSFFYAGHAENISITGSPKAEIDGSGYNFRYNRERPKMFKIEYCKNFTLDNIMFKNSGSWCLFFIGCDQIRVDRLSIRNHTNQNNDGIDFDGCSNVLMTNSSIQSGDDSICLKSTIEKDCENITISNCNVSSECSAFKLGTASGFAFKNIRISDCKFYDCASGTIKLLVVDGGSIDGVTIDNIEMNRCASPIFIRLGDRGRSYDVAIRQIQNKDAKNEGRPTGTLKNVSISNIYGTAMTPDIAQNCMMFTGVPGHYIENIKLENIDLKYEGYGDQGDMNIVVDEDEARYPEQAHFGMLPSYGLYLRHVKGIEMNNVSLSLLGSECRPACYFEDVIDGSFNKMSIDVDATAQVDMITKDDVNDLKFKRFKVNNVKF